MESPLVNVALTSGALVDAGSNRTVIATGTSLDPARHNQADNARRFFGADDVMTISMSNWPEAKTNTFTLEGWLVVAVDIDFPARDCRVRSRG